MAAVNDSGAGIDLPQLLAEVADAVKLQEGGAGVGRVLQALDQLEIASTRAVSRSIGLPLPIVAAITNELRRRGLVTRERPSRLTPLGSALLADATPVPDIEPTCSCCGGHGVTVPPSLAWLTDRIQEVAAQGPAVDVTLDQSHCTADTKLRRVLLLLRYGLLPSPDLLLVGDDDLMSLTVAMVGAALERPLVRRIAVVDISTEILDFIQDRLGDLDIRAELVEQDLREPLSARLAGRFTLAMTDPPYTVDGARLFLSRAVEGLRPGPGAAVAFSFGPKGPDDWLQAQRAITALGLNIQAMHRDFNEYRGAGVIGSRSHLQYLATSASTAPVVWGSYAGPMYTADERAADRLYLCLSCRARHRVGPRARWTTIGALKAAGCPNCGGDRFRPLQLVRDSEADPAAVQREPDQGERPGDDGIDEKLRRLIAEILGRDPAEVLPLPSQTSLLTGELGLSSHDGARLLLAVRERFGVDVASEDFALASLESLETLTTFIRTRRWS